MLQKAFNRLPKISIFFQFFLGIDIYQWLTGERRPKNADRANGGGQSSRPAEASGPLCTRMRFPLATSGDCRIPLSSIQILAYRRLLPLRQSFAADATPAAPEHIVNHAWPSVKKNALFISSH
jgi:hypothetical protein